MGSLPVADIERKQIHIGSIFLQQFFLYSIQFLHITAIEYKPVTVHGKFTRAAFPYSRGGSGDEYNLLSIMLLSFNINTANKGITYYFNFIGIMNFRVRRKSR